MSGVMQAVFASKGSRQYPSVYATSGSINLSPSGTSINVPSSPGRYIAWYLALDRALTSFPSASYWTVAGSNIDDGTYRYLFVMHTLEPFLLTPTVETASTPGWIMSGKCEFSGSAGFESTDGINSASVNETSLTVSSTVTTRDKGCSVFFYEAYDLEASTVSQSGNGGAGGLGGFTTSADSGKWRFGAVITPIASSGTTVTATLTSSALHDRLSGAICSVKSIDV